MSAKSTKPKNLSKEEEALLQDYSRDLSTKSSALFYGNAAIVAAVPIWLYWKIHQLEPANNYIFYLIVTLLTAYMISFAYKNVKFVLKHKIFQNLDSAVQDDKDKKNDDRSLRKRNEIAEFEATTYSIFYNNSLFLFSLLVASFVLFKNFTPLFNYILSMGIASGLLALLSTSK